MSLLRPAAPGSESERQGLAIETVQADEEDVLLVYVPVPKGRIIRRLAQDAKQGFATAAKELRAWLAEYPPQDDSFDPASLSRQQRQRAYALVLWIIEDGERWEKAKALLGANLSAGVRAGAREKKHANARHPPGYRGVAVNSPIAHQGSPQVAPANGSHGDPSLQG